MTRLLKITTTASKNTDIALSQFYGADDLWTQDLGAPAAMILTKVARTILVSAPEGLNIIVN